MTSENSKESKRGRTTRHRWGRVRQLPSGRWQARVPDPNRPGRLIPAPQTFARKVDAERWLNAQETDQSRGVWLDPALGRVTFDEWVDRYVTSSHKRESTASRDGHVIRAHLKPALGNRPLSSISPLDIRRLVEGMEAKLAPATVRTNYGVLRAIFNAAVEAEVIVRTPCRGIRLRPDIHRERRILGPDDLKRIAAEVHERYAPMVYLAGVLGLRWSEVAALRVKWIDFFRSTITVAEAAPEVDGRPITGEPKSRAARRTLAIPPFIKDALAAHLARRGLRAEDADELVFAAPGGGPLRASNFRNRVWTPAVEAAGYPDLTFHDLRHVATSLMVEGNEHPRVIQHRLGHSTARLSMELYAHVSDDTDRQVASWLEDLFSSSKGTQGARAAKNRSS